MARSLRDTLEDDVTRPVPQGRALEGTDIGGTSRDRYSNVDRSSTFQDNFGGISFGQPSSGFQQTGTPAGALQRARQAAVARGDNAAVTASGLTGRNREVYNLLAPRYGQKSALALLGDAQLNSQALAQRDVASTQGQTARDVAGIRGTTARDVEGLRGGTARDVAGIQTEGELAAERLRGGTARDVAGINAEAERARTDVLAQRAKTDRTLAESLIEQRTADLRGRRRARTQEDVNRMLGQFYSGDPDMIEAAGQFITSQDLDDILEGNISLDDLVRARALQSEIVGGSDPILEAEYDDLIRSDRLGPEALQGATVGDRIGFFGGLNPLNDAVRAGRYLTDASGNRMIFNTNAIASRRLRNLINRSDPDVLEQMIANMYR